MKRTHKRRDLGSMPSIIQLEEGCTHPQLILFEELQEGLLDKRGARKLATFLKSCAMKHKHPELYGVHRVLEGVLVAMQCGWISDRGPGPNNRHLKDSLTELLFELKDTPQILDDIKVTIHNILKEMH